MPLYRPPGRCNSLTGFSGGRLAGTSWASATGFARLRLVFVQKTIQTAGELLFRRHRIFGRALSFFRIFFQGRRVVQPSAAGCAGRRLNIPPATPRRCCQGGARRSTPLPRNRRAVCRSAFPPRPLGTSLKGAAHSAYRTWNRRRVRFLRLTDFPSHHRRPRCSGQSMFHLPGAKPRPRRRKPPFKCTTLSPRIVNLEGARRPPDC